MSDFDGVDLDTLEKRVDEATLPGAELAAIEGEIGRRHARIGHHDKALRALVSARRRYDALGDVRKVANMDASIGAACAQKGEHDRALTYLERVLDSADEIGDTDLRASTINLLAEQAFRRGDDERAEELWLVARDHFEQFWNGAELSRCVGGLAMIAAGQGNFDEATTLVTRAQEEAEASGDAMWIGRAQLACGLVLWRAERLKESKRAFRRAITEFQRNELLRDLAESYLQYGLFCGFVLDTEGEGTADPAAYWLAKAQEQFRALGGLADLERVREAFRRYGRRATDKVSEVEVLQLLQELKQNRVHVQNNAQRMHDYVMSAIDAVAAGSAHDVQVTDAHNELLNVEQQLARSLDEMALAEERFLGAVNAVVVERENIRTLLDLTRILSTLDNYADLPAEIAKLGSQLTTGDRGLVAFAVGQKLDVRGTYGIDVDVDTSWRDVVERCIFETGRATLLFREDLQSGSGDERGKDARAREAQLRLGFAIVVPLRIGERVIAAIYLDKEITGGVFTERDLDLLAVFAGQAATILENSRIHEELRLAALTKAATLEAISDGVMSIDENRRITSINAAAKRFLGIRSTSERLPRLNSLPDIEFLSACLDRSEELDGRIVNLANSEFLCNTRVIRSDQGRTVGIVATFTEMKRATSLAQRMVGSTARYSFGDIVGQSATVKRRLVLAEAAARSDSNVLITGESGTGKEVLAQAVHNGGSRAHGPFVAVNCAAIPRDLLESELFGYDSGAFTGARRGGRPGKFELAEGGTILLDEIGDMPLEMQAKLLRVLQERTTSRLGGSREIPLNCRIVATTNRDLAVEVARGLFRQDLFFRLRVIHIDLPPLRDRREDIKFLTDHFLSIYSARMGKQVAGVAPNVMTVMMNYPWPGNIRELEHVLEGEVNLATPEQTSLDEVPVMLELESPITTPITTPLMARGSMPHMPIPPHQMPFGGVQPMVYPTPPMGMQLPTHGAAGGAVKTMSESERELLEAALTAHRGKIPDVARALGVSRGTVYNKMKKFNIDPGAYRG
jgi:transcriptional regulator with PAS, ATPase and Fis domain